MRFFLLLSALVATLAGSTIAAQDLSFREMRWRDIGPTRAGRARALAGVASQPNTFYAGFDNGGVWRSTDYGANWVPLFDDQATGSIGAIAVAPSNPSVIYVGTGAGIIRPDLAIGDGMYKSTDAGRTWQHLGLRDSQMIAAIAVDPGNADRLFVAVLGHPYGPNPERGVFRSTDGGRTFEKVLFKDDYTSANEVLHRPAQSQCPLRDAVVAATELHRGPGIRQRRDGHLQVDRRRNDLDAARAKGCRPSCRRTSRSRRAIRTSSTPSSRRDRGRSASTSPPTAARIGSRRFAARAPQPGWRRTCGRSPASAAATCRRSPSIPRIRNVVYTASTVMWRTLDGGLTWSAVRGAPGGDDYQRIWINPNDTQIILAVADQGAVVSANRGRSWSNWYNQNTAAMYHVTTDNAFPYRVCSGQQDSGSACVQSRSDDGRITFHDWHPVNIQEYGMAAPDPTQSRARVRKPAHRRVALRSAHGTDDAGRTRHVRHAARRRRDEPQRADDAAPLLAGRRARRCSTPRTWSGRASTTATRGRGSRPI